ncbi:hypothetical protein BS17DRAFT_54191 [Gyrodon lividus]|nr:hypothetical protein BS17DRAFT_54191 [Gyrodon lividus]
MPSNGVQRVCRSEPNARCSSHNQSNNNPTPSRITNQPTIMGGPANGNFLITSAVEPLLPIGADNNDYSAVKRVISDGEMRSWSLTEVEPGKWKIVLEENWYSTEEKNPNSVVVQTSVDPGTRWLISENENNLYTIERDTPIIPNMAWTLAGDEPKSEVVLKFILAQPSPNQLWKFHPMVQE